MKIIHMILLTIILCPILSIKIAQGADTNNEIAFSNPYGVYTIPYNQIVQKLEDDLNGDGRMELLLLLKLETSDTSKDQEPTLNKIYEYEELKPLPPDVEKAAVEGGLIFANHLLILERNSEDALKEKNRIDLTPYRPLSIKTGDVNGDGRKEISVCMFKTTYFHPFFARRPFVYDYDGELRPLWQGSRLSKPFTDYCFLDINHDGIDELVSIEWTRTGEHTLNYYRWHDFGFAFLGESESFEEIQSIKPVFENGQFKGIEAVVINSGGLAIIEIVPQISMEE